MFVKQMLVAKQQDVLPLNKMDAVFMHATCLYLCGVQTRLLAY